MSYNGETRVKLCYCDESGTGDEPIAVMAGVIVDPQRMHLTKAEWKALLTELSDLAGRRIHELHTREFYPGNGVWHNVPGTKRAEIITRIFSWLGKRKHRVVYSAVVKEKYNSSKQCDKIPDELNTIWRFLGFHLVLAVQKSMQRELKNKGNTIFVFDNEHKEEMRFTDLLLRPPDWSGAYYSRGARQEALDQLVDVPYFGDSRDVGLLQLADFLSFFLRRYAEIRTHCGRPSYLDEEDRISGWMSLLVERSIASSCIYPKKGRDEAADLFYSHAPTPIRDLGS